MLPSKPSSHLPLGSERASVQFLAGSTDRHPSAPEERGLDKQSRFYLPQPTQPGGRKLWASGCRPIWWWLVSAAVTSLAGTGSETGQRESWVRLDSAYLPGHLFEPLLGPMPLPPPSASRRPAAASPPPPPPHLCPHRAICHSQPLVGTVVL